MKIFKCNSHIDTKLIEMRHWANLVQKCLSDAHSVIAGPSSRWLGTTGKCNLKFSLRFKLIVIALKPVLAELVGIIILLDRPLLNTKRWCFAYFTNIDPVA